MQNLNSTATTKDFVGTGRIGKMPNIRRHSRGDRRKMDREIPGKDRRSETPPDLEIRTKVRENALLVWVENAIIGMNCYSLRAAIQKALRDTDVQRVIINMEKVPYADTAGMGLLANLQKQLIRDNKKLILYRVIPRLNKIIEIMNLDTFFEIRDH